MGMFMLFLRAYSLGGGTYTGPTKRCRNGIAMMRDRKVETGKRTMTYMAVVGLHRCARPDYVLLAHRYQNRSKGRP